MGGGASKVAATNPKSAEKYVPGEPDAELAAARKQAAEQQQRADDLAHQLAALKKEGAGGSTSPVDDVSAELEDAQLENKIFSKTLDMLREEVNRLRVANEKLRADRKENVRNLERANIDVSRLQVQVSGLKQKLKSGEASAPPVAPSVPPPEKPPSTLPPLAGRLPASNTTPSTLPPLRGATGAPHVENALFSLRLTDEDTGKLRSLAKQTKFHAITVDQLFEVFKVHAVGSVLDKRQFLNAIAALDVASPEHMFIFDRLYGIFDRDNSQTVDFGEFVGGLSVLCKGEAQQKLQLLFMLLDADNSGAVSKTELQTFFMTMYAVSKGLKDGKRLVDEEVRLLEQSTSREIESIITSADSNADGELSWEEFNTCVKSSNSKLGSLIEMFNAVTGLEELDEAVPVTEADCTVA